MGDYYSSDEEEEHQQLEVLKDRWKSSRYTDKHKWEVLDVRRGHIPFRHMKGWITYCQNEEIFDTLRENILNLRSKSSFSIITKYCEKPSLAGVIKVNTTCSAKNREKVLMDLIKCCGSDIRWYWCDKPKWSYYSRDSRPFLCTLFYDGKEVREGEFEPFLDFK